MPRLSAQLLMVLLPQLAAARVSLLGGPVAAQNKKFGPSIAVIDMLFAKNL
jgi:hypothetical protein